MSTDVATVLRESLAKGADVRAAFKKALAQAGQTSLPFNTIEEYKAVTGKRFRMTPDQKARKINRDQAFEEFKNTLLQG